jgi:hypothetical protein
VLCKKIRSKFAILRKLATRTPVSTKWTNWVASKNHISGRDRNFFLSDLIYRGLKGKYAENSDQNSKKKFSVLAGLDPYFYSVRSISNNLFEDLKLEEDFHWLVLSFSM